MDDSQHMGCYILDPVTVLVATFMKGPEESDIPILQTWRFSHYHLGGILCATYAMPINAEEGTTVEIFGEQTCCEKSVTMSPPQSVFYPSGRHQTIILLWRSRLKHSRRQTFVLSSVFQKRINLEPSNPIPYLEWSSQQVHGPDIDPIPSSLNGGVCSGRYVDHPTLNHVRVFDFVTPRCVEKKSDSVNLAVGGLIISDGKKGVNINGSKLYSLSCWCVAGGWRTRENLNARPVPWTNSQQSTMVDNEHIICIDVSKRARTSRAEMMITDPST